MTICEGDANTVDESEVEGRQGQKQCADGRHGSVSSLTCNSSQDDAKVRCWGYNGEGQLGYGDKSDRGDTKNGKPAQPFFSSSFSSFSSSLLSA